ncbi:MAG: hypothetical protein II796_01020 [Oscillospiraceae bacterium]|nr:hypothetical protein [Oscillospiraceae bacterium]
MFARIKEIDTKAVEVISQANKKACEIIERTNQEKESLVKQYNDMFLEKKKELYLKSKVETAKIIDKVCAKYENLAKRWPKAKRGIAQLGFMIFCSAL